MIKKLTAGPDMLERRELARPYLLDNFLDPSFRCYIRKRERDALGRPNVLDELVG